MTRWAKSGWPVIGQRHVNSGAVKRVGIERVGMRVRHALEQRLLREMRRHGRRLPELLRLRGFCCHFTAIPPARRRGAALPRASIDAALATAVAGDLHLGEPRQPVVEPIPQPHGDALERRRSQVPRPRSGDDGRARHAPRRPQLRGRRNERATPGLGIGLAVDRHAGAERMAVHPRIGMSWPAPTAGNGPPRREIPYRHAWRWFRQIFRVGSHGP